MRTFIYDDDIKSPEVGKLIDQFTKTEDNEIHIYVRSCGGDADLVKPLIDIINNSDKEITLIGFAEVHSAAFDLFWKTTCNKRILKGTYSILHFSDMKVWRKDTLKENTWLKVAEKVLKQDDEELYSFLKSTKQLTTKELKSLLSYEDIFIEYDRLIKILKIENGN